MNVYESFDYSRLDDDRKKGIRHNILNMYEKEDKYKNYNDYSANKRDRIIKTQVNNVPIQEEELLFQNDHEKNMDKFKNLLKNKSNFIDYNAQNYLNFIKPNRLNESNNPYYKAKYNQNEEPIVVTPYLRKYARNSNKIMRPFGEELRKEILTPLKEELNDGGKRFDQIYEIQNSNSYKNLGDYNNSNNNEQIRYKQINFMQDKRKSKNSDITNLGFFDNVAKQLILKQNRDVANYNKQMYEEKEEGNFFGKRSGSRYNISLPPGHIQNSKYYQLGESRLTSNPIVNPGNHYIFANINTHKKKSEFTY